MIIITATITTITASSSLLPTSLHPRAANHLPPPLYQLPLSLALLLVVVVVVLVEVVLAAAAAVVVV